jgi:hypothetical protein
VRGRGPTGRGSDAMSALHGPGGPARARPQDAPQPDPTGFNADGAVFNAAEVQALLDSRWAEVQLALENGEAECHEPVKQQTQVSAWTKPPVSSQLPVMRWCCPLLQCVP